MQSKPRPGESSGLDRDGGLPHTPNPFRLALLHRLEVLDREIRALDSEDSGDTLGRMRQELRDRLDGADAPENWAASRLEIIGMWRRYRHEFEQLAAARQRRYPVPPGRRNQGPRW